MALLIIDSLIETTSKILVASRNFDRNVTAVKLIETNNNKIDELTRLRELLNFDIFLSHAFKDANLVAGIMIELIKMGYTVYVDWIIDPHLGRENVNKATADALVKRMNQSKSLFYATTVNAPHSKWMPWELGYKHGHNGKCAILPIKEHSYSSDIFTGQEYLGIYDKVIKTTALWICPEANSNLSDCKLFDIWAGVTRRKIQTLRDLYVTL